MTLETIDIFYNNRFYSTEIIEKDSYDKVKNDIEQVWGLDKHKVELVCYNHEEHKKFVDTKLPIKITKESKTIQISNTETKTIKPLYIK
jgi:type I site-specific restriction-modification system R (restriction) subunit